MYRCHALNCPNLQICAICGIAAEEGAACILCGAWNCARRGNLGCIAADDRASYLCLPCCLKQSTPVSVSLNNAAAHNTGIDFQEAVQLQTRSSYAIDRKPPGAPASHLLRDASPLIGHVFLHGAMHEDAIRGDASERAGHHSSEFVEAITAILLVFFSAGTSAHSVWQSKGTPEPRTAMAEEGYQSTRHCYRGYGLR